MKINGEWNINMTENEMSMEWTSNNYGIKMKSKCSKNQVIMKWRLYWIKNEVENCSEVICVTQWLSQPVCHGLERFQWGLWLHGSV